MHTSTYKLLMLLFFIVGCYLTYIGYVTSTWLGYVWVEEKPYTLWSMNTYISVPAYVAFQLCGVWSLWVGGLLVGALTQLLYHGHHLKTAIIFTFAAIFFVSLGFNTLDWMLSRASSSREHWAPWMVGIENVEIESWNFYFLFVILPLFFGGFLVGVALLGAALKW